MKKFILAVAAVASMGAQAQNVDYTDANLWGSSTQLIHNLNAVYQPFSDGTTDFWSRTTGGQTDASIAAVGGLLGYLDEVNREVPSFQIIFTEDGGFYIDTESTTFTTINEAHLEGLVDNVTGAVTTEILGVDITSSTLGGENGVDILRNNADTGDLEYAFRDGLAASTFDTALGGINNLVNDFERTGDIEAYRAGAQAARDSFTTAIVPINDVVEATHGISEVINGLESTGVENYQLDAGTDGVIETAGIFYCTYEDYIRGTQSTTREACNS